MRIFKIVNDSAIATMLRVIFLGAATVAGMPLTSAAEPSHALAMFGKPALPADAAQLPYTNPMPPRGG